MNRALLFGIAIVAGIVGCGDSKKLSEGWIGKYTCSETVTLTFTTPADMPEAKSMLASTWTITSPQDGTLTAVEAYDMGATCTLSLANNGGVAMMGDSQTCAPDGLARAYTAGDPLHYVVYSIGGDLTFAFKGKLAPADEAGTPQMVDVEGTGVASTSCTQDL